MPVFVAGPIHWWLLCRQYVYCYIKPTRYTPFSTLLLMIVQKHVLFVSISYVGYCPSTASFSVRPYCKNATRDRCQEYHNCFPFGGLEETTRTSSNYVDEDYPARPEIKQSLTAWGDNCGSESSTLETDVCVWRYAPLVVHATQEEEEEDVE